MTETPLSWYNRQLVEVDIRLKHIGRQITQIAVIRLLTFALLVWLGYLLFTGSSPLYAIAFVAVGALFLWLVVKHGRAFRTRLSLITRQKIYQAEVKAADCLTDDFEDGLEFAETEHPYAYDLDLFGKVSVYALLARCVTYGGKQLLANGLKHNETDISRIAATQQAVKELAAMPSFLFDFRTEGMLIEERKEAYMRLLGWAEKKPAGLPKLWLYGRWVIPVLNVVCLVAIVAGVAQWGWLFSIFAFATLCSLWLVKRSVSVQDEYDRQLESLRKYARLMMLCKTCGSKSPLLRELNAAFETPETDALTALNRLAVQLKRLEWIHNQFLFFFLEGSCFFQAHVLNAIYRWKKQYAACIPQWIDALARWDCLNALAVYAYNHPTDIYPTLVDEGFIFEAEDMGHPLMNRNKAVTNDISMRGIPSFLIITGANMAGKSTYLRTVGVNFVLACMGLPVYASAMCLSPRPLFTSLRTTDSLSKNESYFFAELKRLQRIIRTLEGGQPLFILLDEILKGTNSTDKQQGSMQLMERLVDLKANGIIATHDLLLGDLIYRFPTAIANFRFEARIDNDELVFDYRMQPGVAQNMNASFLMRKMGITTQP